MTQPVNLNPLRVRGVKNPLWNEDLSAIPPEERSWGVLRYVSLWAAMSVCIPSYLLASGLIALGLSCTQALGTLVAGNLIVLIPIVLNAHAGTKYGIPFAVCARASFGVLGAKVPAILRSIVTCGWFGIQCWIGGQAIFAILKILLPSIGPDAVWYCFFGFWLLKMAVIWRGVHGILPLQVVSAPIVLIVSLAFLFWMVGRAGGFITVLGSAGTIDASGTAAPSDSWRLFVPSLTAVVGFWAAVALNIPDVARYAKSQKAQMVGHALGLPIAMALYSFLAIAVTAATVIVSPARKAIWSPIEVVASYDQPWIAMIGLFGLLLSTASTNVVSPSNDFSNLSPGRISRRMGGLITGVLGVLWMPWKLVADPGRYLNGWLIGYSGLLGPIAGIMIADYFIVRKRSLNLEDLYVRGGVYEYVSGFNLRALSSLAAGVVVALVGLFVPRLYGLYQCAWFVGFAVAGLLYVVLMSSPDVRALIPPNPLLLPVEGFAPEQPMAYEPTAKLSPIRKVMSRPLHPAHSGKLTSSDEAT